MKFSIALFLRLCSLSFATSNLDDHKEQQEQRPIFHQNIVLSDIDPDTGDVIKQSHALAIQPNQEPVDAIYAFALQHNLDHHQRHQIQDSICASPSLTCHRDKAILWGTPVSRDGGIIGRFELYEDVEPIDAVYDFCRKYNLASGYRNAILGQACEVVDCTRVEAVLWRKNVVINGSDHPIEIVLYENEEVADKIFTALLPFGVSYDDRRKIMNLAKEDGVMYRREYALVFSELISISDNVDDAGDSGEEKKESESRESKEYLFEVYDNGMEPIDTLYEFINHHALAGKSSSPEELSRRILPKICSLLLPCARDQPIVWKHTITAPDADGTVLGVVEILKDEEPIDAIDRFCTMYGLDNVFCTNLIEDICQEKSVHCDRTIPVVFTQTVNGDDGSKLGVIEIFKGEEVVDATVRFLRQKNVNVDEVGLKNYMFQNACNNPRVACTRNVARVYNSEVSVGNGTVVERLEMSEHDEPIDAVYHFCDKFGCQEEEMNDIFLKICEDELVRCERKVPIIFSLPMKDPDGTFIGNLEIKRNQEPADATYRFFAFHDLFGKEWNLSGVIAQVCDLAAVECGRQLALKFHSDNFQMGDTMIGALDIWDGEEVIDTLYDKRIEFNLTLHDQMKAFGEICYQRHVYCERSQAIVYELTDLSKLDFEKYGNETCSRKYNGWQFLSSVTTSSIGSIATDAVRKESVEHIASHPLFSVLSLGFTFSMAYFVLYVVRKKGRRYRLHIGYDLVIYFAIFTILSIIQTTLIEPKNEIDHAMHLFEGKLPDLVILEGQEPADAVLLWGKAAAKDHHPIVREPIYWDVLDKVCAEIKHTKCRRRRAWAYISMGSMTVHGVVYNIDYYDSSVDPTARDVCSRSMMCAERAAQDICERIVPALPRCALDLARHIDTQLEEFEEKRIESKDTYIKLGLEMDAPQADLYPAMSSKVRHRGMNVSPFQRVDNGTAVYPKWDTHTNEAYSVMDAYIKVKDEESREWNDKPCTPYFGGALCAKTDKDGNMKIEV